MSPKRAALRRGIAMEIIENIYPLYNWVNYLLRALAK